MLRALVAMAALFGAYCLEGDVLVTTWNMKWFPSGKANVREDPPMEESTIRNAGGILSDAVSDQTRRSDAGLIVLAQEVRDAETMSNYVHASGIPGLKVAAVSGFLDGDVPIWQQDAVLTTLPVLDSGFATWSKRSDVSIPRGFAYALLDGGAEGPILCFSIHLKSNLNQTGSDYDSQKNIYKREAAAAQILAMVKKTRESFADRELRVIVGGDFNTDDDDLEFVSESTIRSFYGAHFRSCFRDLKKSQKITHPAAGGFPDATFDYILYRGFERIVSRRIYPGGPVSDHNLVALRLK